MRLNLRLVISFGIACASCLGAGLFALPAVAGLNSWTAIGPDGTSVTALVIDPRTPSTAFAGTLGSGILKSTDSGLTWAPVNLGLPTPYILALAIDPTAPSRIYAGTSSDGVFKSTDGGHGWSAATTGLVGYVNALAIDPTSPTTLYAATVNGVFKTIDGAANWISVSVGLSGLVPSVIAIDPTMPSTLYIGVDDSNVPAGSFVFKSVDGGTSWTRIYTPPRYPLVNQGHGVRAIAIDPSSSSRIYVALRGSIARSTDGGASWYDVGWPLSDLVSLAIDPASPATLYAGTYSGEIFRTTDAGATGLPGWLPVTQGPLASSSINAMALASSTPATIYAGGDTGIYRSTDNAQTWTRLTLGVRNISAYPLAVDPSSPSTIYSTVGGVVVKTTDGGGHWAEMAIGPTLDPQVTNSLVIDPAFPATIYAGRGNSALNFDDGPVYKSIDGGTHWADASHGLPNLASTGIALLAIAPSLSSTLYASLATRGVSKSVDGGLSWRQVNNGLPADGAYTALAIDPTNVDTVYVATFGPNYDFGIDATVFKSTDGGGQWQQVSISGPAAAVITTLAVDPAMPSTIYASYGYGTDDFENAPSGFIFKSIDSGATWTAAQNGFSSPTGFVYALAIDPSAPSRIYAGTHNGVFMSTDTAANWTPINDGLTGLNLNILAISIDRTGSILRAASTAGLFEYQIAGRTAASPNYQGLWWATGGTESGWGVNFVQHGTQVFATWYTYNTAGKAWWLSMLANKATGEVYSGPIYATAGPPFNSVPFPPVTAAPTQVGTGTLTLTDANNGSFNYTVNGTPQTKAISRFDLGTGAQPACAFSTTTPNFAGATNYQDLWWVANGAESGWGVSFAHQGDSVFATWYTYDVDGTPLWLSALAVRVGTSNAYTGKLYRTAGPRFDAYDATKAVVVEVGTATLTFADGNHAKFDYVTNGGGSLPGVTQSKQITRFPFAATGGTVCN